MKLILFIFIFFISFNIPSFAEDKNMTYETAIFAGGCFWCTEAAFDSIDGVIETTSGYAGGTKENPTYQDHEGYYEALQVTYDPAITSYDKMLKTFWLSIDPFDAEGQFYDRGQSYQTAIFYLNDTQKEAAIASKKSTEQELGKPTAPKIIPAGKFYPAEDYHQNYHEKNPLRYKAYKYGSGRPDKLKKIWGKYN